jgi:nitrate reductase delta subunit
VRRRRAPGSAPPEPPWAVLPLALRYPDPATHATLREEVEAVAPGPARAALERFLEGWDDDVAALAAWYVETFDLRRRAALELTYYAHGDRRERGLALLRIKKLYRVAGLPLGTPELPDHLTVMLAFAALAPPAYGVALLTEHLPALELLRLSLHDLRSPYAHLLDVVMSGLPALGVADRAEVARLTHEGPPEEAVGLELYGLPEAMPTAAQR